MRDWDFAAVLFDRGLKDLPNKMTPRRGREWWGRRRRWVGLERKYREKWTLRMWETEAYNDYNEGNWQVCSTVKTFRMSESKSKMKTWSSRFAESVTVSSVSAVMCPFSAKMKSDMVPTLNLFLLSTTFLPPKGYCFIVRDVSRFVTHWVFSAFK